MLYILRPDLVTLFGAHALVRSLIASGLILNGVLAVGYVIPESESLFLLNLCRGRAPNLEHRGTGNSSTL